MDNAVYASLSRQSGLMREMRVIANNIANAETAGFRREGVIFAEYLGTTGRAGDSLSMAHARGRQIDLRAAPMAMTNAPLDLALDGPGFFMVETPQGQALTRAGAFMLDADGGVITPDGFHLLDDGGAPIGVPPGATSLAVGADGTLSADGEPVARIGVFAVADPGTLMHRAGTLFSPAAGTIPAEETRIRQGFLEGSNVNPMAEMARMIEVQRAYELGQSFLAREDERIRAVVSAMSR